MKTIVSGARVDRLRPERQIPGGSLHPCEVCHTQIYITPNTTEMLATLPPDSYVFMCNSDAFAVAETLQEQRRFGGFVLMERAIEALRRRDK